VWLPKQESEMTDIASVAAAVPKMCVGWDEYYSNKITVAFVVVVCGVLVLHRAGWCSGCV
jgi:hypothetical protein